MTTEQTAAQIPNPREDDHWLLTALVSELLEGAPEDGSTQPWSDPWQSIAMLGGLLGLKEPPDRLGVSLEESRAHRRRALADWLAAR